MPPRTPLSCLLLLLATTGAIAREPVTRAGLLAALTGNEFLGTSADGKLAWLQKSSGTVEPVGGSRVILVIIRLHTRSHVASVPLMSPGMMVPAAIPAADLAKALALLRDYRIQAGGTSPTTLPVVINGTTWSLASTENGLLTLLRNGSAEKSFNISEVRKDPFRISATRLTQDNRYLLVEFYRGEGSSRAGIAEREWYYNMVVFELK